MIPALKAIIYIAVMMVIIGTKTQYHAVSSNKFLCKLPVGDKVRHLVPGALDVKAVVAFYPVGTQIPVTRTDKVLSLPVHLNIIALS